jgi:hypothetical protein
VQKIWIYKAGNWQEFYKGHFTVLGSASLGAPSLSFYLLIMLFFFRRLGKKDKVRL